jgi:two-component system, OmpR family, response regulator
MSQVVHTHPPFIGGSITPARIPVAAAERCRPLGVLVVDDEEGIRRVVEAGLRFYGLAVWVAADGREAVEVYRSFRDVIDITLLDVRMAGRDGPQTLVALRELDPDARACFMSGYAGPYSDQNLLDLGALAVFKKPLRLSELAHRLMALVPRSR